LQIETKINFKKGSIIFIWFISAVWMVPEFFLKNGYVLEGFLTHCSFDYIGRDHFNRIYMMVMFCGGFFLPLSITIILNILIFRILKTKNEQFYSKRIKSNRIIRNKDFLENKEKRTRSVVCYCTKLKLNELRILKTIILMVILFCLSWSPYAVMTLFAQYGNHIERYINPYTANIPALFAKTSTFMNPIVYSLANKDCRNYLYSFFFKKNNSTKKKVLKSFNLNYKLYV